MNVELEALLDEIRGLREDIRALSGAALTRDQAAAFLGVGVRTFDKLVAAGRIHPVDNTVNPSEGKRGRVTFRREELERYLRESEEALTG